MTEFDVYFDQYDNLCNKSSDKTDIEHKNIDVECIKIKYCQDCCTPLHTKDCLQVCYQCGNEYEFVIDESAEWKLYGSDDHRTTDPTRCGASRHPILTDSSFSTTIKYSNNPLYKRLRHLSNWNSQSHFERSAQEVFSTLSYIGQMNGLTANIVKYSHRLYFEAKRKQQDDPEYTSSRGDPRSGLIAACLAQACKEYNVARSAQEIVRMCKIHTSDFTRGKNLFNELMKNSYYIDEDKDIIKHSDYLIRYCTSLSLTDEQTDIVSAFANKVYDLKILSKHTPESMLCGCIYFVSIMYNLGISKDDISSKCGTSKPTINHVYKKLVQYTEMLV